MYIHTYIHTTYMHYGTFICIYICIYIELYINIYTQPIYIYIGCTQRGCIHTCTLRRKNRAKITDACVDSIKAIQAADKDVDKELVATLDERLAIAAMWLGVNFNIDRISK